MNAGRASDREETRLSPAAGCALSVALGLALACLVSTVVILGLRGELVFGRGIEGESRVWLVHSETDEGLGISWVREVSSTRPELRCESTRIIFLLWRSQEPRPPLEICTCYRVGSEGATDEGACPS